MSFGGDLNEVEPSPYSSLDGAISLSPCDSVGHTEQVVGKMPPHTIVVAQFEKQPPDNMRKSNFFNFEVQLFDSNSQVIEICKANFNDFYDSHEGQEYRNGLIYKLTVKYADGVQREEQLYVRLIDSTTKQLVPYEGTCKNPDLRRVLLTHELICSRCLEHRSCGNKNDTPSDPVIIDKFRLRFFVKCNQNCLKNAGNPKDTRRRFQVAIYSAYRPSSSPIACSDPMFVHNNSKHGRKPPPFRESVGDGKPYIIAASPSEGWISGGTRVCIVGMNFFEGLEVVFGTLPASCEVLSPNAIAVRAPQSPRPGEVDITLTFKGSQFCMHNPGKFLYISTDDEDLDHNFARLERILRNQDDQDNIPKDILLRRAADALEMFYSFPRSHATPNINQLNPMFNYPHSPALFALTPQPFTPARLGGGGLGMFPPHKINNGFSMAEPTGMGGGGGYMNKVHKVEPMGLDDLMMYQHRAGSMEGGVPKSLGGAGMGHSIFEFPPVSGDLMGPEGGPLHPKGRQTTPFSLPPMYTFSVVQAPYHEGDSSGPGGMYMEGPPVTGSSGDLTNRNNNNSTVESHPGGPSLSVHSNGYMPRIVSNGPIPSSPPGHFMPPSSSPGLPVSPTALPGSGASTYNFCSPPQMSPMKNMRSGSKATKPVPLGTASSELAPFPQFNYPMFAALPSTIWTLLFPPTHPDRPDNASQLARYLQFL
eukprot:Em0013g124a